jgi:hypothetical protein
MNSDFDDTPRRGHRILGIDAARSLAIFLMVIENYKNAMQAHGDGSRWLIWFFSHIEGCAAPAFVTLMSVALPFSPTRLWNRTNRHPNGTAYGA